MLCVIEHNLASNDSTNDRNPKLTSQLVQLVFNSRCSAAPLEEASCKGHEGHDCKYHPTGPAATALIQLAQVTDETHLDSKAIQGNSGKDRAPVREVVRRQAEHGRPDHRRRHHQSRLRLQERGNEHDAAAESHGDEGHRDRKDSAPIQTVAVFAVGDIICCIVFFAVGQINVL